MSNMSEASNYPGAQDYATHQNSTAGRVSDTHTRTDGGGGGRGGGGLCEVGLRS